MLNALPVTILLGILLGFLSGLGIGGGSLLILWLTMALQMHPEMARVINLLFFLPCGAIACYVRIRNQTLQLKPILPAILAGCITAAIFSWVSTSLDTEILKKIFGTILLIAGIKELLFSKKEESSS